MEPSSTGFSKTLCRALVDRGFECLEARFDYLGLGAKTAAGYGAHCVPLPPRADPRALQLSGVSRRS